MNKSELVGAVAEQTHLTRAQAASAVEAMLESITAALKRGDKVRLVGFGTFAVVTRAAGVGRNLRTGEQIRIPAAKTAKFQVGQALKDAVNA